MQEKKDWKVMSEGDTVIYEHVSGWEVWWRWQSVLRPHYLAMRPGELGKPLDAIGKRFLTLKDALEYCEQQAMLQAGQPHST